MSPRSSLVASECDVIRTDTDTDVVLASHAPVAVAASATRLVSRAPPSFALSAAQQIALQTSDVPVERVCAAALDVPVVEQFAHAQFPVGEQQLYAQEWNLARVSSAEKRQLDRLLHDDVINVARHAAEVHRQVRARMQQVMKPGMLLTEICDETEALIRQLVRADGLLAGVAFPTGASLNHCAAHFAPNTGDKSVLKKDDLIKLDFGVHIGGRIIDCAFTQSFCDDQRFDQLLEAVAAATNAGIATAGIDVRLSDVGAAIEEVMSAYEITLDGKKFKVRPIRTLCGHSIEKFKIHAGKTVPCVAGTGNQQRMEEGEFYAIETFGSTGKGVVTDDGDTGIFMLAYDDPGLQSKIRSLRNGDAIRLLKHIQRTYSTLAFCRRWLDAAGVTKHTLALKHLCDVGIVDRCPPLVDRRGCFTAQFEHTILLRPTCKEVLTRGDDY
jgi:methionyl aminopeptidase